jgi:hypothetical protein
MALPTDNHRPAGGGQSRARRRIIPGWSPAPVSFAVEHFDRVVEQQVGDGSQLSGHG